MLVGFSIMARDTRVLNRRHKSTLEKIEARLLCSNLAPIFFAGFSDVKRLGKNFWRRKRSWLKVMQTLNS